ncbi:immunoglobulin superfamily member 11 [Tachysurus fulvidraco]|uniref:immunoglobulin superfamily member 11 n=1 Tax=Tachysurus fulvidraco TaxID=1234273 RepID=UPI000F4D941F|nr:immunoglobulin superfamily member 11 [Tachysurus fulvidraco]XP_047664780.1 immunoglobulin superfamily member 11 [Tachysurus fulvidraco]
MGKKHECYFQNRWLWTSLIVSALMPGVVLAGNWVVHVPVNPILAPQGSSVILPCTYDFPDESGSRQVQSEMWCLNEIQCITPAYVYHSGSIFPDPAYQGRVKYLGSLGSKNCSLSISDLTMKDSGVYVFRFITNHPVSKLPRQRGVTLQVTDPPVNTSVTITSSGHMALGTSVTLSCSSFTTSQLITFTWFQMNGTTTLRGRGRKLTIAHLTSKDSGTYTCIAQNIWGSQNATITLTIHKEEGSSCCASTSTAAVVISVILVLALVTSIVVCTKRHAASKSFQTMLIDDGNL